VVTGASSGIGRVAAISLADAGATVAAVGRNPERTGEVAGLAGGKAHFCDFNRLDEVRQLAAGLLASYGRIDVLANNAGGVVSRRAMTEDGFERNLQLNYLAPFLLTRLLLPKLAVSGGRVVFTSSVMNRYGRVRLDDLCWTRRRWVFGWGAYSTAKLMTNLFARELARRSGVPAYSFHPGFVRNDRPGRGPARFLTKGNYGIGPDAGARPLIYLASEREIPVPGGTYFHRMKAFGKQAPQVCDELLAATLWELTSRLVNVPVAV
jgi:NAD(P)-dependent dehydrogenase (short-subunit alcohol dehydrogenase family)